jgi:thiosulfate/3-mercaptopyruvate sulfurtransferase
MTSGETIDLEELASRLGNDDLAVLDVRTEAEYAGTGGYPCDPRQGHLPGSRHMDIEDLTRIPPQEVRQLVGLPRGSEIVTYCHSGSRSAIAAIVLRSAGFKARNYVGSWHEWSRRDDLPTEADEP